MRALQQQIQLLQLNVDAEDGLYCPLQIRHLDLDFIAFQG